MRKEVKQAIKTGIENNESVEEIEERVQQVFNESAQEMIARFQLVVDAFKKEVNQHTNALPENREDSFGKGKRHNALEHCINCEDRTRKIDEGGRVRNYCLHFDCFISGPFPSNEQIKECKGEK